MNDEDFVYSRLGSVAAKEGRDYGRDDGDGAQVKGAFNFVLR